MTQPEDIIIEFINIGNVVKVTAICSKTGREVSIVGNPRASKQELQTIAVNKLRYVMNKEVEPAVQKPGFLV
ncbi:hypothetical protein [Kordiimonas sp. SCSIO 12610]|uniref:DUF6898 family protein n=1 Tax=Kordiimonas sp. SCSIO 12610 TaxID=2829597 RepID=UPI00210CC755|nr:hypothetical protein [Kordiimonas sp. SCSIO 12610]UTW54127.1 hypothetical protein KFF44_09825 [Kordiimonas sp. SCSIO 12610]